MPYTLCYIEMNFFRHRLLSALEDFTGSVPVSEEETSRSFSQDNFALSAAEIDPVSFEGLTFSTDSNDNFRDATVATSMGTTVPTDSIASISLPPSLLVDGGNESQRISFALFADDTLFQPRQLPKDLEVGSVFVSAILHGSTVSGLTDTVTIILQKAMVS